MERRNFLRGLLVSATAGEAIIKLATAEETQALVVREPVVLGQPTMYALPNGNDLMGEVFIRNRKGGYEQIGYITDLRIEATISDMTSWNGTIQLVPGVKRATASFEGKFGY